MRTFKKLLALVLAVCMLIGMPLSIDVSAMNSTNPLTKLELSHVIPYIADSRWSNVAPDSNYASYLMLYFNSLTGNKSGVGSDILVVDKNGALIRDENDKEVVLLGWIAGGLLPNWNAPLGWQLRAGQSFSGKTINNFYDVRDLLASEYYAAKGAKLVFRLYEDNSELTGRSDNNGFINTYYCAHDSNIKWSATETLVIGNTNRDGIKKEISWNQVTFNKAQAISDNKVRITFSEPISNNAGKNNIFVALRIVDQNYALKYVNNSPKQWGQTSWEYASGDLVCTFGASIQSVLKECADLNAAENTDKYMVTLCLEEKNLSGQHGEAAGSGYVDSLWGSTSKVPLAATSVPANNTTFDGAYCKLSTVDDLKKNAFQIESANVVSRANHADRVVVTFTEPVSAIPVGTYIRIFDNKDALMTHDPATKKLGGSSNHLQWSVSGWTKASTDGKKWIGNLGNAYNYNTLAGIYKYASELTDAAGKAVTVENGYKIQMSFLDQGTHTNLNGLIDNLKSTTGKALWASNVQSNGEERAVCNFSNALQITGVDLYNNNQVVITFNKDIDINKALTAINTTQIPTLWISGAEEIMNGANPICPNRDDKGHIQSRITNAKKFGNANNKLLLTGGDWNAMLANIDAYNAKWGVNAYPILHIQGGKADGIIPGFVGTDGSVLYNSCPKANDGYDGWAGRHMTPVTNTILGCTVTKVTANSLNNSLTVEFSHPVKYNDVKNADNGSRTQIALAKFYIADDGKLNLVEAGNGNIPEAYRKLVDGTNGISQPYETGYQASDANGAKVNTEYSKYWTFYFEEGVVDSAVAYYAEGNTSYDPHIGFGFAIYEDSTGDGKGNYGTKLTLGTHLEDFVSAPDADGMQLYLKSNSTHWGQRYFKAPTVAADTIVKALSAEIVSAKEIKVTFSEPVKEIHPNLWVSLRVTPGDNYLIQKPGSTDVNADYQTGGNAVNTFVAVNPDANGYSAEWIFNSPSDIIAWAKDKFFNDKTYADVANRDLTFSIEGIGGYKADGILPNLQNKDGMSVLASKFDRGVDGLYMSIKNDPAFDEGAVALYNGESYTSVAAAVEAANANGGKITMIANDVFTGANGIVVAPDTVLDLAGKTLNMGTGSIVGNGHIIDSTNGAALIVMDQITDTQIARFSEENPQLPMYDTEKEGYRLFNVAVSAKTRTTDSTDKKGFGLHLDMAKAAFELMAKEGNAGASVVFTLRSEELKDSKIEVVFSAEKLTEYASSMVEEASDTLVFALWVSGLDQMADQNTLTVEAAVVSAGAQAAVTIQ